MATIINPYRYAAGGGGVPDFGGASYIFDGIGDYINCGNDSSLELGTNALSISFWTTLGSTDGAAVAKVPASGNAGGYQIQILNRDVLFSIWNVTSGFARLDTTTDVLDNDATWKHIACTAPSGTARRDRTNWKIYVNGSQITSGLTEQGSDHTDDDCDTTDDFLIGQNARSTPYFVNGNIADLRIYNTELSGTDVSTLNGFTHISDGLIGWWLLDNDDLQDFSSNANDGTAFGDAAYSTDGPAD